MNVVSPTTFADDCEIKAAVREAGSAEIGTGPW